GGGGAAPGVGAPAGGAPAWGPPRRPGAVPPLPPAGRLRVGSPAEQDRVVAVHLGEQHPDELLRRGGQVLADVVGADRQLPVAPVDKDRELHRSGPAEIVERV